MTETVTAAAAGLILLGVVFNAGVLWTRVGHIERALAALKDEISLLRSDGTR